MAQVWKCICGAEFERAGFELSTHIKNGRDADGKDAHKLVGLVDTETGEVLAKTVIQAVRDGVIPRSSNPRTLLEKEKRRRRQLGAPPMTRREIDEFLQDKDPNYKPSSGSSSGPSSGPSTASSKEGSDEDATPKPVSQIRARFFTQELNLDGRLIVLFDLTRTRFPTYTASMEEWIFEIITRYYEEHSDEMSLGVLFPELAPGREEEARLAAQKKVHAQALLKYMEENGLAVQDLVSAGGSE